MDPLQQQKPEVYEDAEGTDGEIGLKRNSSLRFHSPEPPSPRSETHDSKLLQDPLKQVTFIDVPPENDDNGMGKVGTSIRRLGSRLKKSFRQSVLGGRHLTDARTMEEDRAWLEWIEHRIGSISKESQMDPSMFKKVLDIEEAYYADRLFSLFDVNHRGFVLVGDLLQQLSSLTRATAIQKLRLIFDVYDADGNQTLDHGEFIAVLSAAIDDNALAIAPQQIEYMTNALFDAVDKNCDGVITFDELKLGLDKFPEWSSTLQISFSRFLKPPVQKHPAIRKKQDLTRWCPPYFFTSTYIRHNPREFGWAVFYALSVIAFYLYGALYALYDQHEITTPNCLRYYVVAHGFGMNLNWNSMLLVVFMLRRTLTFIRNTKLGPFFPIDVSVFAHKIIGYVVGVCVMGHWILHMVHFQCLADEPAPGNFTYREYLFTTKPGLGIYPGVVSVTGWPLLFAFFVIFACSLPVVRRSGLFEIFFFTHLLYIPYMLILIVHSDKFWKFIIVPGIIFVAEKLSMTRCVRHILGGQFYIKEATMWSSGVTQLTFNHPPGFTYNPGDYVFINIPNVAWFEWHPFTISSCPERLDVVTLHIRTLGEWTRRVHTYFKNHDRNCGGVVTDTTKLVPGVFTGFRNGPSVFNKKRASVKGVPIRALHVPIYIDGPYGTPSGRIFNAEHAVLICAGIGVTPFASILQSIMYRHMAYKTVCPNCLHEWSPHMITGEKEHLKKVTFIWVVNSQRSIEWFVELLEQLDLQQLRQSDFDRLIDIHIYVTSATKMADLYAFALTSALDIFYEKHNRDMITGIRSRAIPGRPNWKAVFEQLGKVKRGKVSVFFCGPPVLAHELRNHSHEHDFEFHKESF